MGYKKPENLPAGYMGIREYAREKGIKHTSVLNAIETGKIKTVIFEGKKWINQPEADKDWLANYKFQGNSNPILLHTLSNGGKDVDADKVNQLAQAVRAAKDQKDLYAGLQAKLDYEIKAKLYVSREEVNRELHTVAKTLREHLLRVPDRVIDDIRAASDRATAFNLLYDSISRVLEAIADGEIERITEKI